MKYMLQPALRDGFSLAVRGRPHELRYRAAISGPRGTGDRSRCWIRLWRPVDRSLCNARQPATKCGARRRYGLPASRWRTTTGHLRCCSTSELITCLTGVAPGTIGLHKRRAASPPIDADQPVVWRGGRFTVAGPSVFVRRPTEPQLARLRLDKLPKDRSAPGFLPQVIGNFTRCQQGAAGHHPPARVGIEPCIFLYRRASAAVALGWRGPGPPRFGATLRASCENRSVCRRSRRY